MEAAVQDTTVESQGATAASDTSADTATVDQQSYIDDAFKDYFVDPRADADKQVVTPKADDDKAKTLKDGEVTDPDKNPDEHAEDPNKKPDPFETAFSTESGDFDLNKLVGLSLDGLDFKREEVHTDTGKDQVSDIPQWKQEYETEKRFRENIDKSRLGPLESVFAQVEEAEIPIEYKQPMLDLLRNEYAKIKGENEAFLRERDEENAFKRRQEDKDKIADEIRASKLPELAKTNAMAIISKLPGEESKAKIDLYNRIMFGPDAGGELLEDMFQARYPDFSKKPKAEQDKMKLRFVNELQADGGRLQRHFNRAYRYLTADPKNMKKIMEQVSRSTDANVRSNALAVQKKPDGSVQRQPQAGSSKWDGYFANPEGTKTRI